MRNAETGKKFLIAYGIILGIACIMVAILSSGVKLDFNVNINTKKEVKKETKEETKLTGKEITIYKMTNKELEEVRYGERSDFTELGSKEELEEVTTFNCSSYLCTLLYANEKYALVSEKDKNYNKVVNVIDYKKNTLVKSIKYSAYNIGAEMIDNNIVYIYTSSGYLKLYNIKTDKSYETNKGYLNENISNIESKYVLIRSLDSKDSNTYVIDMEKGSKIATITEPVYFSVKADKKIYLVAVDSDNKGVLYTVDGKKSLDKFRYIDDNDKDEIYYVKDSVLHIVNSDLKDKKKITLKGEYKSSVFSAKYNEEGYETTTRAFFYIKEDNKLNLYEFDKKKQKVNFVTTIMDNYKDDYEVGFVSYTLTDGMVDIENGEYVITAITSDELDIKGSDKTNYKYSDEQIKEAKLSSSIKYGYYYYYNLKTKKLYKFPYIYNVDKSI